MKIKKKNLKHEILAITTKYFSTHLPYGSRAISNLLTYIHIYTYLDENLHNFWTLGLV